MIASLFEKLRRTRDGQIFVRLHAGALAQLRDPARSKIKAALLKALESKDDRTVSWARYVLDKSGLQK